MKLVIAILGVLIAVLGAVAIVRPGIFRDLFGRLSAQVTWVLAVVLRLAIGTILLMVAGDTRLPQVMNVIGWIAIVAAVVVLLLGPERLEAFVEWWLGLTDGWLRTSAGFACAFGVFLAWAAL
ncbi:MAG: hypothetical protein QNJ07_12610 [Woeseiaceae bacterium]|nr:hypothetical protein [Woeseiaceae bacterium]